MMILADLTAGYYHDKEINPYCDLILDYCPDHTDEEKLNIKTLCEALGVIGHLSYPFLEEKTDIGFFVAPKYCEAKKYFICSGLDVTILRKIGLGGMVHSHMPGTYYYLSVSA